MAKHVLYNPTISLNGVDLTDHVESVEFTVELNDQDAAAMGDVEDYSMPGTRKVSDIKVKMYQDFAASKTYATLMTLWTNRTSFNTVIKPDSAAVAATNPQFTVSTFIKSFPVVAGKRGDRHMTDVVLKPAGVLAIATS
ncbi:MAG TPA: hypothetical protein VEA16_04835 [Vicinamibacterales bacterium]|nr:hypothetical protein [Vicinamibacterales bacterium]